VEVLPFHQTGSSTWDRLSVPYTFAETRPPDDALVDRVRGQFRARGLTVW
jgi:pyruvate formate lyase activating enzyme